MRTAKQFREMAWHVLQKRYWWAVLAAAITLLLGGYAMPSLSLRFDAGDLRQLGEVTSGLPAALRGALQAFTGFTAGFLGAALALAFLFVGANVELGYDLYHLRQYQSAQAPGLELLFSRFSIFWRAVGLRLLIMLKVFLWSLLLIVPGVVAACRYALAPYILAENPETPAAEAIERSKALMEGHKARLFRLWLSFIGWFLLAALTAGIGLYFLAPYVKTAMTGFYLERTGRLPLPGANSQQTSDAQSAQAAPEAECAEMI